MNLWLWKVVPIIDKSAAQWPIIFPQLNYFTTMASFGFQDVHGPSAQPGAVQSTALNQHYDQTGVPPGDPHRAALRTRPGGSAPAVTPVRPGELRSPGVPNPLANGYESDSVDPSVRGDYTTFSSEGSLGPGSNIPKGARLGRGISSGTDVIGEQRIVPGAENFRRSSNQYIQTGMPTTADVEAENELRSRTGQAPYTGPREDAIAPKPIPLAEPK